MTDDEISALRQSARDIVTRYQRGSISLVQRHLCISYNKAAALLEQLEREGVVGPMYENGGRAVLVAPPEFPCTNDELTRLRGETAVMRELLRNCLAVISIAEPLTTDEADALADLNQKIERAIGDAKGTLL